ncbi:MAG: hypothetical protein ACOX3V_03035 [Bacillota bacterium]
METKVQACSSALSDQVIEVRQARYISDFQCLGMPLEQLGKADAIGPNALAGKG